MLTLISHLTLFYPNKHKNDNMVNPFLKIHFLIIIHLALISQKIFCDFKYSSISEDMLNFEYQNFPIVVFALFNHMVL